MDKSRKLSFGVYETTDSFKNIPQHSCVCFADDMGLVAVTGPADDKESQEYAQLFSVSLDLLEALEIAADALAEAQGEWEPVDEAYCPSNIAFLKAQENEARAAIAKAKWEQGD